MDSLEKIIQAKKHFDANEIDACLLILVDFYKKSDTAYYRDIISINYLWFLYKDKWLPLGLLGGEDQYGLLRYLLGRLRIILNNIKEEQNNIENESLKNIKSIFDKVQIHISEAEINKAEEILAELLGRIHSRYHAEFWNYIYGRNSFMIPDLIHESKQSFFLINLMREIEREKIMVLSDGIQRKFLKEKTIKDTINEFESHRVLDGFKSIEKKFVTFYDKIPDEVFRRPIELNYRVQNAKKMNMVGVLTYPDYFIELHRAFDELFNILEEYYFEFEAFGGQHSEKYPDTFMNVKQTAKVLIGQGKSIEAIESLIQHPDIQQDNKVINELILQQNILKALYRDDLLGLSMDRALYNKATSAVLMIIDEIK